MQKKGCAQRASPRPWYARFALPMAFERAVPLGLLSLQRNIRAFDRAHAHRRIRLDLTQQHARVPLGPGVDLALDLALLALDLALELELELSELGLLVLEL